MNIIGSEKKFFKNPHKLPLNELTFECKTLSRIAKNEPSLEEMMSEVEAPRKLQDKWCGRYQTRVEKRPALDQYWIQTEKRYVEFHPFYPQFDDKENEQFLIKNREFLEILEELVACTYQQFWCYVVYESRVSSILTHFLKHSIPLHVVPHLNQEFLKVYDQIYVCVYNIYERLVKFKVSECEYMSEGVVMEFLKSSQLLNVGMIFSLCFLYNHSKPNFIRILMDFYFCNNNKENYTRELTEMLVDILQEFEKLDSLNVLSSTALGSSMLCRRPTPGKFDPAWLEETSSYILEMTTALNEFLFVCRPAVEIAFKLELPHRVSHIYQNVYAQLYDMLESNGKIQYDRTRYGILIKRWLAQGRLEFVNLFYGFTCYLLDNVLKLCNNRAEQEKYLETYLGLISAALDDDIFILDYNKTHPLATQFQILIDHVINFDKTQTDYLLESLHRITEEQGHFKCVKDPKLQQQEEPPSEPFPEDVYESIYDTLTQYSEVQQSNDAPEPVLIALRQYAQLMRKWETNPNCWEEKLQFKSAFDAALSFDESIVKPNEEEIECRVKCVLEMLPDLDVGFVLKCLERMDYRPELVISRVLDKDLPGELNFADIEIPGPSGSNREDRSAFMISHTGKKPDYADAKDLLDDKKEKRDIKDLVLKASYAYDLDDDYDDRNEVYGAFERNDESKIYRHLKQPADGPEYNVVSDPSSGSSDEDADNKEINQSTERQRNAFCEDPAIIRARREAQRGRTFRGSNRDVSGRPKGHGQDKNVQQNRDKKNIHKSSRANHNRKGGAQWKRNKGMLPS